MRKVVSVSTREKRMRRKRHLGRKSQKTRMSTRLCRRKSSMRRRWRKEMRCRLEGKIILAFRMNNNLHRMCMRCRSLLMARRKGLKINKKGLTFPTGKKNSKVRN